MSVGRPIGAPRQATGDRLGSCGLLGRWVPDLGEEVAQVRVGLLEQFASEHFDADGFLEQFGRREPAVLHRSVEIVGQIDLHSWHTPKHAHMG